MLQLRDYQLGREAGIYFPLQPEELEDGGQSVLDIFNQEMVRRLGIFPEGLKYKVTGSQLAGRPFILIISGLKDYNDEQQAVAEVEFVFDGDDQTDYLATEYRLPDGTVADMWYELDEPEVDFMHAVMAKVIDVHSDWN